MKKDRFLGYALNTVLAALTCLSLVQPLLSAMAFIRLNINPAIVIISTIVVFAVIFFNKLTLKITGALIGAALAAFIIYTLVEKSLTIYTDTVISYFLWLKDALLGLYAENQPYETATVILLSCLLSLLVFIFAVKKFNFYILLAGGSALFVLQRIYSFFDGYNAFYLYTFLIVVYYFKHVYAKKTRKGTGGYAGNGRFTSMVIPVAAVIFFVAFSLPAKSTPLNWPWLDNTISSIINSFYKTQNYTVFEYFSVSSSGFGAEGRLGGKVILNKTHVLTVNTREKVYLKGSVSDTYTGFSWTKSEGEEEPLPLNKSDFDLYGLSHDENELINVPYILSDKSLSNTQTDDTDPGSEIKSNEVAVSYARMRTRSLFTSVFLKNMKLQGGNYKIFADPYGVFSSDKWLDSELSYRFTAYSLNDIVDSLSDQIKASRKGVYNELLEMAEANGSKEPEIIIVRDDYGNRIATLDYAQIKALSDYAESIYDRYLQLPEELPDRVRALAESITAGKTNNYDKVKAIESYISENYSYTLVPGITPINRDFTDYFLFELKEGYCTYYATAMAVLTRAIGMPARYVEGYILPPKPVSATTYHVTNQQAHAWAEVYFEGIGWLPFEATAPFRAAFYEDPTEKPVLIDETLINDPYYQDYMDFLMEFGDTDLVVAPKDDEEDDIAQSNPKVASAVLIIICSLFLLALPVVFFRIKIRVIVYNRKPNRECVLAMYRLYIRLFAKRGLIMSTGETATAFSERVDKHLGFGLGLRTFSEVTDIFVKARYSTALITDEEKDSVIDFFKTRYRMIRKFKLR